jgi:hypothetical protein
MGASLKKSFPLCSSLICGIFLLTGCDSVTSFTKNMSSTILKTAGGAGAPTNNPVSPSPSPSPSATTTPTSTSSPVVSNFGTSAEIYYSDMTSAPLGAYVTVWGQNFGTTAGTVKVGSTSISGSNIVSWASNMVVFKLTSSSGNGISLLLSDGVTATNQISFTARSTGNIYYISQADGNNSYTGLSPVAAGGSTGPWADLSVFITHLHAGDVVYVRAGNYTNFDARGGSSWGTILFYNDDTGPDGTAALPVAIVGYPGENPVVGAPNGGRDILIQANYITIAKLTFGNNVNEGLSNGGGQSGLRFVGNQASQLLNTPYDVIDMAACTNCQILGNLLHDCGTAGNKLSHLIYYGGYGVGANVEIAYNTVYNEFGGRGIQVYGHTATDSLTGLSIHNNIAHNNAYDGIIVGNNDDSSAASWIHDATIENNLLYNNGDNGLRIDNPGVTATVSNNTAYGNGAQGSTGNYGIYVQSAGQANLTRNLVVNNVGGGIHADSTTYFGTVTDNGYYEDAVCTSDTAAVSGNPLFVNASTGNFQLSSGSPMAGLGCYP